MKRISRLLGLLITISVVLSLTSARPLLGQPDAAYAATPPNGVLNPPAGGSGTSQVTWAGGPYTVVTPDPTLCTSSSVNCDTYTVNVNLPADYWGSHEGNVAIEINWANSSDDFDLYILDSNGNQIASSATAGGTSEKVNLGKLAGGTYQVRVVAYLTANATYTGKVTLNTTQLPQAMVFPENKDTIMRTLTVDYPVNVIFVGYTPTVTEVADLKNWIPDNYQPTVAQKSPSGDETQNAGAGLLNWNKNHLITSQPYFTGIRYNYKIRIIQASDEYAKALFQVAKDNTAQGQSYHATQRGGTMQRYDDSYGNYRVAAKGGDASYKVTNPQQADLIDAFSVEDWIFNSRYDTRWGCNTFRDLETGQYYSPAIMQPGPDAYYDNYYDKNGLNLDRMPQGTNAGSSFLFLDTFTPSYAKDYFRSNAYHTWGTDKVINGAIVPKPVEEGGSWRITDPDTKGWAGVDYGRTWGGRYRLHFVDIGAAPNDYESASWLRSERAMSSDYPFGDPPVWQYQADPQWMQSSDNCAADPQTTNYTGGTPCRMMPRLGRDVAYGLFFRSTAGYLYRPIPRGDVNWLAVSNWTDFYSRPQWVTNTLGVPTLVGGTPLVPGPANYGTWWTNTDKLYKINTVGNNNDDVLRWLSAALPYTRWVGRKDEQIPIYDPATNQPSGKTLDTSPKYEDLPAPKFHFYPVGGGSVNSAPEPLYPGDGNDVIKTYGSSQVNLTQLQNALEKAKARGLTGSANDFSVDYAYIRDYIDANRPGIADVITGVNTIPAVNMVFEKGYTWALPLIVGGIAAGTNNGEAWGVLNNVNDRFKWSKSDYPLVQPGDPYGSKRSSAPSSPNRDTGTGFSYTIEHEAAHNLGLSHPHDGSFGVDRCPNTDPDPNRRGKWECYWSGLGWMYDISAAPTTYAMTYRPYEVEDQDNLQRGRTAEYLVTAQDSLRARLVQEVQAGRTTPSPQYQADYNRMVQWRQQTSDLFKAGDYLHAEYAARNASLAARGVPQTASNTTDPKLLEAGQVFYFNIYPQAPGVLPAPCAVNATPSPTVGTPAATTTGIPPTYTPTSTSTAVPGSPTSTGTRPTATATSTGVPPTYTRVPTSTPNPLQTATSTPTVCPIQFQDVPPSSDASSFYPFVRCLACRGVLGGYPCGGTNPATGQPEPCGGTNNPYFRPANNISRGQIAKIVSNSAGFNDAVSGQTYADVPPSSSVSSFYPYIERLTRRGVMAGYACGTTDPRSGPCDAQNRSYFRPANNATRGQLSKIVANTAGYTEQVSGQTYADVPPSAEPSSYYQYVERLTRRGVMSGYACGTQDPRSGPCDAQNRPYFRPDSEVTRAQASKIVANTFFPNCQTP